MNALLALALALGMAVPAGKSYGTTVYRSGSVCRGAAIRPQDTVWLISTRQLGCASCQPASVPFRVWRYESGSWLASTIESFYATDDPAAVTAIYVHGNRIESGDAIRGGMTVYAHLRAEAAEGTSLRYVIWSWPSDQVPGPLRDARSKAQRTESEGYYLGYLLCQMNPDLRVSLTGYSFGARIITGALQCMAAGRLAGSCLPDGPVKPRTPVRVVSIAGAVESSWLWPGFHHGQALSLVDRMLVVYNSRDFVLKRYALVEGNRSAQALGYTGLIGSQRLGEAANRLVQIDAAPWVGKTHDLDARLRSAVLMGEMAGCALWQGP